LLPPEPVARTVNPLQRPSVIEKLATNEPPDVARTVRFRLT
jgi:hypothetical protein